MLSIPSCNQSYHKMFMYRYFKFYLLLRLYFFINVFNKYLVKYGISGSVLGSGIRNDLMIYSV